LTTPNIKIKLVFITCENISFELSPEVLPQLDTAAELVGRDDDGNTVDFKPTDGTERLPPPAAFW